MNSKLSLPQVVSREEWLKTRKELLTAEKELTHHRDEVNTKRRNLPMVEITKKYVFEGDSGKVSLLDLFEKRRQLLVYHFMFDPNWDRGCPSCSFLVDGVGHLAHFHGRDTTFAAVSRAPLAKIKAFKKEMGWKFPWYSSFGSEFNYDFHVTHDEKVAPIEYNYTGKAELLAKGETYFTEGESHGLSVFLQDGEKVFHTYSTYARGAEQLVASYNYLDMTALGRQENWETPPGRANSEFMAWVRYHDEYETAPKPESCCCSPKGGCD